ncbi:MAG: cytochrome c biogenesis protein CcdA [Chloroflexi bacterium]|nr:cytochrome c biogenesis protein CcdA [Chloroflexota bacterium]
MLTEGWVGFLGGPWGFAFAFAAGVLSFLSPCVLPLVPAYLAHLTGTTGHIEGAAHRRETIVHASFFVAGFTTIFTFLGASIGLFGYAVRDNLSTFERIAGLFLIVMGLNLVGVIRIPWLYRTYTLQSPGLPQAAVMVPAGAVPAGERGWLSGAAYMKSFGVGSAFSVGWTPCIGPVLGAILTLAASGSTVAHGAYLLFVYSLGLGLPFLITAFAFVPVTAFLRRIRGALPVLEVTTGVLVMFVGVLVLTHQMTIFNRYFDFFGFSQI